MMEGGCEPASRGGAVIDAAKLVSQARLSRRRRESGQIPINLLLSSSVLPNEVGVSISWDVTSIKKPTLSSNMPKKATVTPSSSLSQLTRLQLSQDVNIL